MSLYPAQFIEDLKQHADIVVVIQDYVSLKKSGASYKGLCPFHSEKTPSFTVNRDKGFFHCHGCKAGGDVIKFLELHEKLGFQDAVKLLAQRFGVALPELKASDAQRAGAAERETLLKVHEAAAKWFREQLLTSAGARIRKYIGAYIAALGGADAIAFTAGVGENSAEVRAGALGSLVALGVHLDEAANAAGGPIISTPQSPITVMVIPTKEEGEIASQTAALLRS